VNSMLRGTVKANISLANASSDRFTSKDFKKEDNVILEVFLDRCTYESLVEYCRKRSFDTSTGFAKAVERGMKFFRAAYYREIKQDYLLRKKQAEEFENDNRALKKLEQENQAFRKMLNGQDAKGEI
jgi:hypothetical protein